ncbi:hypothetical protein FOZ80_11990 [Listeria monocytogenes]|nr:hypothetical protein [Listeria monocytogenes]
MNIFRVETVLEKEISTDYFSSVINVEGQFVLDRVEFSNKGIISYLSFNKSEKHPIAKINDIHQKMINYAVGILDLEMYTNKDNYDLKIFNWEDGEWKEVLLKLSVSPTSIGFEMKVNDAQAKLFIEYLMNKNKIPLGLILLKRSKTINDSKSKFISIVTACEVGVKECYSKKSPELGLYLEDIQSPPLVKLLGTLFHQIFGERFPKELRTELGKMVELRNKIVHKSERSPNHEELYLGYLTVLRTLNFLNKVSNNGFYNQYYDEDVSMESTGSSATKQIKMSKKLEQAIKNCEIKLAFGFISESIIE